MTRSETDGKMILPPEDDDDIEIVEIVGLDESAPIEIEGETGEGSEDSDDLILDFDDDSDHEAAAKDERQRRVRLQADFENYKKRTERERDDDQRYASARVVQNLLPVLDNFERAIASAKGADSGSALHRGVQLIFRQILDELRREGLRSIDTVGEPFDPEIHEAVETEEHPDLPHQTITEELQRGYMLNSRLLRPALVKVSTQPGTRDADSSSNEGI